MYAPKYSATIVSDNGLSPVRNQIIIWTDVALLAKPQGTCSMKMLFEIPMFSCNKIVWIVKTTVFPRNGDTAVVH